MWAKLTNEYVKTMNKEPNLKNADLNENKVDNFQFGEEMESLSNHIDHQETTTLACIKTEVTDDGLSDPLQESMVWNDNSSEALNFEAHSSINNNINNENEDSELSDEFDGGIIMELGDESIKIPAEIIEDEDGTYKDDIIVNITPKGSIQSSDSYIPIELEVVGNDNNKVKIPYQNIFELLNLNEELNLQIDTEADKSNKDDVIALVPKRPDNSVDDEDPTSEVFFYKTLALTANCIDDKKKRLELRKKVCECVMDTVLKYYLEKEG